MDFAFDEQQEMLRRQARDLLDRESPMTAVRALLDDETGHDPALWSRIAGLGWTAIPFAEAHGGLGLGLVDLTVILEELGRHLTPLPLQSSVGLAGMTLRALGDGGPLPAGLLSGIVDGTAPATLALVERGGRYDLDAVTTTLGGGRLDGIKSFVPDAHTARTLLVVARAEDGGLALVAVPADAAGISLRRLSTMDPAQRMFEVSLEGVVVDEQAVLATGDEARRVLTQGLDAAAVMVCAELCGVIDRCLEMAVGYAKERHQFGRPIGSYQAVAHRCADMLVLAESSRSLTYHAAWAVDSDAPERALAVSMAKAYCSDAARDAAGMSIQVHGGIGFTWEHDAHLYFKRAKWGEVVLGDARQHRERVARLLDL